MKPEEGHTMNDDKAKTHDDASAAGIDYQALAALQCRIDLPAFPFDIGDERRFVTVRGEDENEARTNALKIFDTGRVATARGEVLRHGGDRSEFADVADSLVEHIAESVPGLTVERTGETSWTLTADAPGRSTCVSVDCDKPAIPRWGFCEDCDLDAMGGYG